MVSIGISKNVVNIKVKPHVAVNLTKKAVNGTTSCLHILIQALFTKYTLYSLQFTILLQFTLQMDEKTESRLHNINSQYGYCTKFCATFFQIPVPAHCLKSQNDRALVEKACMRCQMKLISSVYVSFSVISDVRKLT